MMTLLIQLVVIGSALVMSMAAIYAVLAITRPVWTAGIHCALDAWDSVVDRWRRRRHGRDVRRAQSWRDSL